MHRLVTMQVVTPKLHTVPMRTIATKRKNKVFANNLSQLSWSRQYHIPSKYKIVIVLTFWLIRYDFNSSLFFEKVNNFYVIENNIPNFGTLKCIRMLQI